MHTETPIYRYQFFDPYGQGTDLPLKSAIYFQSFISVTFESTFYFYLLKQIFLTTFYFLESTKFSHYFYFLKVEFLVCTSTFLKVAKSSTFDNTDLRFPKSLNYFCAVIGLPSLICGHFVNWGLVDSQYRSESVLVLLFLTLFLPLVKFKHHKIACIRLQFASRRQQFFQKIIFFCKFSENQG